jgi:HEAT repeat protein
MTKKDSSTGPTLSWEECMELLEKLPSLSLAERAAAIESLVRNPSPGVRGQALQVGSAILPEETLIEYLRSDTDAVHRNAATEILKIRGSRSFPLAVELLEDEDPDVVLQAVLILDHLKDPRAFEALRRALHHSDPNVAQAAIVAVGRLGDARAISDLLPFLESDTWLRVAAIQALGDIRSQAAVEPLSALLTDLMSGPLAIEALARIGGEAAYRAISEHWLRFQDELDTETTIGFLAHVVEGLPEPPAPDPELRLSLAERLRDPYRAVRLSAARCLLALGPGPEDAEALNLLADSLREGPNLLPSCLSRRTDLTDSLLERSGAWRFWGLLSAAKHPGSASPEALARALTPEDPAESLDAVIEALREVKSPVVASALLDFYLGLPVEERAALEPVLAEQRDHLAGALQKKNLAETEKLVLQALLGEPAESIGARIVALEPDERVAVITRLEGHPGIVRQLPWTTWLEEEPERYAALAAQSAIASGSRELLPTLRSLLERLPVPDLVRAVGELGDREAVPTLIRLLDADKPLLFVLIIENLGRIGGPDARRQLQALAVAEDKKIARLAYKALASCATEEDDEFFRQAIDHQDWLVRLACVEVLGRFTRQQNMTALAQLAADPVAAVAERAASALEG